MFFVDVKGSGRNGSDLQVFGHPAAQRDVILNVTQAGAGGQAGDNVRGIRHDEVGAIGAIDLPPKS